MNTRSIEISNQSVQIQKVRSIGLTFFVHVTCLHLPVGFNCEFVRTRLLLRQSSSEVKPTYSGRHLRMDGQDNVAAHLLEAHLVEGLENEPESPTLLGIGVE